jgi:hypothetical protein
MNNKWDGMWKTLVVALFHVVCCHFPEEAEENDEDALAKIVGLWVNIWTRDFLNPKHVCYLLNNDDQALKIFKMKR